MVKARPNIFLICSDATRAEALGCYGGEPVATPCLDAFAREAIRFDRAYAPSTWTFASMASVFTSTCPSVHQLRLSKPAGQGTVQSDTLHPRLRTLAELLGAAGYHTAAVVSNLWLKPFFGVTRGFGAHRQFPDRTVAETVVAEWERIRPELPEPWFVYLHFMDCHEPFHVRPLAARSGIDFGKYGPDAETGAISYDYFKKNYEHLTPEDFTALERLYLGELNHLDSHLAAVLDSARDAVTVFTADHGELLRGPSLHPLNRAPHAFGHFKLPYEQLVRVPLMIRLPEGTPPCEVTAPVSLMDVAPTLMELAGIDPPPGQLQGRSIVPVLRGEPFQFEPAVFCEKLDDPEFPYHERALVERRWKYVQLAAPAPVVGGSLLEPRWHPVGHRYGDAFELLGYTLEKDQIPPGGAVPITLYWRALQPLKERLLGMVFFVSQENRKVPFYAKFFPAHGLHRPEAWAPGEIVEDPLSLPVPADAPPVGYALRVGLYDLDAPPGSDAEDAFFHGTRIVGTVEVAGSVNDPRSLPLQVGMLRRSLAERLAGSPSSLSVSTDRLRAGDTVGIRLEWHRRMGKNRLTYTRLRLRPAEGPGKDFEYVFQNQKGVVDPLPESGRRSFVEILRFTPDPFMPPGRYRVELLLGSRRRPWLKSLRFIDTGRILTFEAGPSPRFLAGGYELVGANLVDPSMAPGVGGTLRLLWRLHPPCGNSGGTSWRVRVRSEHGDEAATSLTALPDGPSSPPEWPQAVLAEQVIRLDLPSEFPEGECEILMDEGTGESLPLCRGAVYRGTCPPVRILREMLFDLESDPGERHDLRATEAGRAAAFRRQMDEKIASNAQEARKYVPQPPVTLDGDMRRQLAALGYLEED